MVASDDAHLAADASSGSVGGTDRPLARVADLARTAARAGGERGTLETLLLVVLVALYPFHTVVGVAGIPVNLSLGDPVVALVGVLWLAGAVGSRRLPRYLVPVGAFALVAVASLAVAWLVEPAYFSPVAGGVRLGKLGGAAAWMVAVYVLVREDPARRLPVGALASAAVAAVLALGILSLGFVVGVERVAWPFENPNLLGNYLLLNLCLGGYAWTTRVRDDLESTTALLLPGLVAIGVAVVATGSRGALLGAVAAGAVVAIGSDWVTRDRLSDVAVVAAAAGLAVLVLVLARNPGLVGRALSTKNLGSRVDLWTVAAGAVASNPLLGIGYGQFPFYLPTRIAGWSTGVHNTYLLLAAEVGVVGLVAFLAIVALAVRDGLRLSRAAPATVLLVAFLVGTMGQAVGTDVDNFRSLWLTLGAVAAYADWAGLAGVPLTARLPLVGPASGGTASRAGERGRSTDGDRTGERVPADGSPDARPTAAPWPTADGGRVDPDSPGTAGDPGGESTGPEERPTADDATVAAPQATEVVGGSGRSTETVEDSRADPAVSVVITTYNEAEYVEDALDAILAQTLEHVEVVIVDDGSEDDTVERIEAYDDESVRLIERGRLGRSAALNCAIEHAAADYVAIVDPDDPSRPDRLERQYRFLEEHPEVGAVGSAYEAVDRVRGERYVRRYPTEHEDIVAAMPKYIPLPHSSMMARTAAIEAAGGYDERLDAIVDLDLLIRLGQEYRLANLDEPLIRREIRPDSSFHSMYTPLHRRLRLFVLGMRAVDAFSLPWYYRAYPPLHLCYSVLPSRLKRLVRRRYSRIREQ